MPKTTDVLVKAHAAGRAERDKEWRDAVEETIEYYGGSGPSYGGPEGMVCHALRGVLAKLPETP